jgi:hypothetical protein
MYMTEVHTQSHTSNCIDMSSTSSASCLSTELSTKSQSFCWTDEVTRPEYEGSEYAVESANKAPSRRAITASHNFPARSAMQPTCHKVKQHVWPVVAQSNIWKPLVAYQTQEPSVDHFGKKIGNRLAFIKPQGFEKPQENPCKNSLNQAMGDFQMVTFSVVQTRLCL